VIAACGRPAWQFLAQTPALWVLVLAAGATNATFNWAVTIGDVVRVVLLFYLMPLWAVLLARLLLKERLTRAGAGCAWPWRWPVPTVVLWPGPTAAGRCRAGLPDWLGLIGGFSFALNNVMLRREAHQPEARAGAGDVRWRRWRWPARWRWCCRPQGVGAATAARRPGAWVLPARGAGAGLPRAATWRCSTAPRA
jgi:drug/metabolite transporter (DMT)-like permease